MSSDAGPSRKRTRLEDSEEDGNLSLPTSSIPKDDDVWLSDGSIVVVAADKVAFRVHKSLLSLRSEIFRDLFSLPNVDAATAEVMDGCPVVRVSDSPEDIRRLFLVLCCGKNYYYNGGELVSVPLEVLASLVRMAHKYAIQDVLADALFRLKKYYTSDLAAWQDPDSRARYVTATDDDAPAVVELARLTNTPSLLPAAFLVCAKLATRSWVHGDESMVSAIASLPISDQLTLTTAKVFLTQACATRTLHLLAVVPCTGCTTRGTCKAIREAPLGTLRERGYITVTNITDQDALQPMAEQIWANQWAKFCARCQSALRETDEKFIKMLWSKLPRKLHLPLGGDS
ncbi:hypothetical protein LXA43DRAFT_683603 [Ganoderma leucocontextum]|nr:hypothetical protein LXA43DRAFT_683603 [Ganoderma leucocontextum]